MRTCSPTAGRTLRGRNAQKRPRDPGPETVRAGVRPGEWAGAQCASRVWAAEGLDLAVDASEPIICRWSVEISEPHAPEEVASGVSAVHMREPSACCGFHAMEALTRRRVDNLRRHNILFCHEQKLELMGQMSALVFKRAQVGHEQFASVDFHRSTSLCSHRARFENRLAAVNKYGRILRYYRLEHGENLRWNVLLM